MAAPVFDAIADALEQATSLDRLQARGTLRLVLKAAGLRAASVKGDDLAVAIETLLSKELDARGIDGAGVICAGLVEQAKTFGDSSTLGSSDPTAAPRAGPS